MADIKYKKRQQEVRILSEMIILNSPFLLICFGVALFFCIIDVVLKNRNSTIFFAICIIVSASACIYSLLAGASMQEVLIVILIFFAIDLLSFSGIGRGDGT